MRFNFEKYLEAIYLRAIKLRFTGPILQNVEQWIEHMKGNVNYGVRLSDKDDWPLTHRMYDEWILQAIEQCIPGYHSIYYTSEIPTVEEFVNWGFNKDYAKQIVELQYTVVRKHKTIGLLRAIIDEWFSYQQRVEQVHMELLQITKSLRNCIDNLSPLEQRITRRSPNSRFYYISKNKKGFWHLYVEYPYRKNGITYTLRTGKPLLLYLILHVDFSEFVKTLSV